MHSFYKSIGLYEHLSFNMDMNKSEFIESLRKITYKTNTNFISLVPDNGIPTRFEYRGIVNPNNFTIRRRIRFFDSNISASIIKGQFLEKNNRMEISIEFFPLRFHILILLLFSISFLIIVLYLDRKENNEFIFPLIMMPIIISTTHYFTVKRNIQRSKYDFERELYFISQKNTQLKKFK
ncbi:hypothetical protein QF023_001893 [Chryseobacterium sp. SLBN-27]|nr:hypothetical protein [Chryseobacterium sp. SLBN-27]